MGVKRKLISELIALPKHNTNYTYSNLSGKVLMSEDSTLGYYLNKVLGITPAKWDDVKLGSVFNHRYLTDTWAITHPSLGKRIKPHLFKTIDIDDDATIEGVTCLNQQLVEGDHAVHIYTTSARITQEHFKSNRVWVHKEKRNPSNACCNLYNLTLTAQNSLTFNNVSICDITKEKLVDKWFSSSVIKLREHFVNKLLDAPFVISQR